MLILAIDCCLDGCSAAIARSGAPAEVQRAEGGVPPAEQLVPLVRDLIASQDVDWSDLSALAVTVGPGSFTGIRTGLAAARGFSLAGWIDVFAIGTLEARAFSILEPDDPTPILIIDNARRNEVFVQGFSSRGVALAPAQRCAVADLAPETLSLHRLAGSGVELLAGWHDNVDRVVRRQADAGSVALAAMARCERGEAPVRGTSVAPLYLRQPDARSTAGRPIATIRQ